MFGLELSFDQITHQLFFIENSLDFTPEKNSLAIISEIDVTDKNDFTIFDTLILVNLEEKPEIKVSIDTSKISVIKKNIAHSEAQAICCAVKQIFDTQLSIYQSAAMVVAIHELLQQYDKKTVYIYSGDQSHIDEDIDQNINEERVNQFKQILLRSVVNKSNLKVN